MKRIFPHIVSILILMSLVATLPSCRSSKGSSKDMHTSKTEQLRKGRKKHDKNDKDVKLTDKARKRIVAAAYDWLGTPYGYGMAEKGKACDCSGMVVSIYEQVTGAKLPRNSAQQSEFCHSLKKKDVMIGDLCFFATGKDPDRISHVGIMIDENNFIHSSTSKGVVISDITQPYYVRTFKGYGRVPL